MKILIIAYYYPPETYAMMASLRPQSWAKYWSEAGHEIRILTTPKNRSSEELAPYPKVKIEEVPYGSNPFQRRKPAPEHSPSTDYQPSVFKKTIRNGLLWLQARLGAGTLLYGSNLWIFPAYRRAVQIYRDWPFDLIISTFSPPADHVVAHLLKQKYQQFWVADYRDLWSHYSLSKSNSFFRLIERKIESVVLEKANLLTTVSAALGDILNNSFEKPVLTIENGFDQEIAHYTLGSKNKRIYFDGLRLVYTGSIYPQKRDPIALFKSLSSLTPIERDKVRITFASYNLEYLEQLNREFQTSELIALLNFLPREECLKLQADADLLIFLDWNDDKIEGILTGKIFEYMASGTPVINIGCERPTDASRLIEATGIGVNLGNNPQKIADCLRGLLQGEKIHYQPNYQIIQQYSRQALAQKMLNQILERRQRWLETKTPKTP